MFIWIYRNLVVCFEVNSGDNAEGVKYANAYAHSKKLRNNKCYEIER